MRNAGPAAVVLMVAGWPLLAGSEPPTFEVVVEQTETNSASEIEHEAQQLDETTAPTASGSVIQVHSEDKHKRRREACKTLGCEFHGNRKCLG